jgi:hypothetical protein
MIRPVKSNMRFHWEDAEIPGVEPCDVEINLVFIAYPGEEATYTNPASPPEADVLRVEIRKVTTWRDGSPVDITAETNEADIVCAFWAHHDEKQIQDTCLESIETEGG